LRSYRAPIRGLFLTRRSDQGEIIMDITEKYKDKTIPHHCSVTIPHTYYRYLSKLAKQRGKEERRFFPVNRLFLEAMQQVFPMEEA